MNNQSGDVTCMQLDDLNSQLIADTSARISKTMTRSKDGDIVKTAKLLITGCSQTAEAPKKGNK